MKREEIYDMLQTLLNVRSDPERLAAINDVIAYDFLISLCCAAVAGLPSTSRPQGG